MTDEVKRARIAKIVTEATTGHLTWEWTDGEKTEVLIWDFPKSVQFLAMTQDKRSIKESLRDSYSGCGGDLIAARDAFNVRLNSLMSGIWEGGAGGSDPEVIATKEIGRMVLAGFGHKGKDATSMVRACEGWWPAIAHCMSAKEFSPEKQLAHKATFDSAVSRRAEAIRETAAISGELNFSS